MTTSSITIKEQHDLLDNATAAVSSFTAKVFDGFFSRQDREDIVGNTMVKACRSLHRYDPDKGKLSTWVSKIAVNCVLTAAVDKRNHQPISHSMVELDEDGDECSMIDIYGCSGKDYEADRNVDYSDFERSVREVTDSVKGKNGRFLLMIEDGLTPKQMAEVEGCTADAAATRKCKILAGIKAPIREIAVEFDVHNDKLVC